MANRLTNKNKDAFLKALKAANGNVSQASALTGVGRRTHYDWMQSDPEYAKEVDAINEANIDFAEEMLRNKIGEGDTTATIFFLKTKGKKRGYVEKQEIEHQAKDGFNIIVNSKEEADKLKSLKDLDV